MIRNAISKLTGGVRTRSGRRYGSPSVSRRTRKQRSNKGVKRGPITGKTRSGARFRGVARSARRSVMRSVTPRVRKQRSNKGKKRGAYGPRTGRTRSGRIFKKAYGKSNNNLENVPDNYQKAKKKQPKLYAALPSRTWEKKDVKRYLMQQSSAGTDAEFNTAEESGGDEPTVMLIKEASDNWTQEHINELGNHGWVVIDNVPEYLHLMKA